MSSPTAFGAINHGRTVNILLWDVEDPTLPRQSTHRWRWSGQPYAPVALYSAYIIFLRLVLNSVRGCVNP
jgi:hypothetical protein